MTVRLNGRVLWTALFGVVVSAGPATAVGAQVEVTSRSGSVRIGGQLDMHYVSASPDGQFQTFRVRRGWITVNAVYDEFLEAAFVTDVPNNATVLDAYVRLNFDPALRVSFGRFKRSFDLFVLNSIADIQFLERAGGVPGYNACTGVGSICSYGQLSEGLLFSNRDTGVRVDGTSGRFGYSMSLTNGTRNGAVDNVDGLSLAGRIDWTAGEGLVFGLNATRKDYAGTVGPLGTRYATAWGPDVQVGTWRDGLFVQAAYLGGDNWQAPFAPDGSVGWFHTGQVQASWYVPRDSERIEGIEPMLRISLTDPSDEVDEDGGLLLTPGFAAYFRGRNRVSANLDIYRPSGEDAVWAFRVGTLLYF